MSQTESIPRQQPADESAVPIPIQLDPSAATPVFGTAEPTSGVPARLRRQAYGYPAWDTRRWMLLLAADRAERAAALGGDALIPGRQPRFVRHWVRIARGQPEGVAALGAAVGAGLLLRQGLRRRSG
jgi:hypothetical protein